jgi:tetratricopeptide (TPR) repeat protein
MKRALIDVAVLALALLAPAWTVRAQDENHGEKVSTACFAHSFRREFDLAIRACSAAIALAPKNPQHYVNRGSAYLTTKEPDRALEDFEVAIRLAPQDARSYYNRALAHTLIRNREKAIQDYSEAIRLRPGFAPAYNNRGYQYELLGQRDKARSDYEKAFELDPTLPTIRENLDRLSPKN